ncbi:MAG: hypothetical protein N2645_03800 [Clostridia bacterium]|nr:hypothetical protein [Clostridia bacterium]
MWHPGLWRPYPSDNNASALGCGRSSREESRTTHDSQTAVAASSVSLGASTASGEGL